MSEMRERIAEIIFDYDPEHGVASDVARTVIEAMREPTEEMVAAFANTAIPTPWGDLYDSDIRNGWRAMINAALKEPKA